MMRTTLLRAAQSAQAAQAAKRAPSVKTLPPGFVPRKPDAVAQAQAQAPAPASAAESSTPSSSSSSSTAPTQSPTATPADNGVRVGLRPPRKDRKKSVMDSFRGLPSNTRIIVGLGLGLVGFAGLWVDRQIEEEDGTLAAGIEGEEAKKLPISIRVVDRK